MKRRQIAMSVMSILLGISLLGCVSDRGIGIGVVRGSGQVTEQDYAVSGFDRVRLDTIGDLVVTFGEEETLRIEAEDNLIEHLTVQVEEGRLIIGSTSGVHLQPTRPVTMYLTARSLQEVDVDGSGDIHMPDWTGDDLTARVRGSGDIALENVEADSIALNIDGSGEVDAADLQAQEVRISINGSGPVKVAAVNGDTLDIEIDGSGDVNVSEGQVQREAVRIHGSGSSDTRGLTSEQAEVIVQASGSAILRVSESLQATIDGSGDVRYYGDPTVDQSDSGSGRVIREGN